jgi:hypothetical protein
MCLSAAGGSRDFLESYPPMPRVHPLAAALVLLAACSAGPGDDPSAQPDSTAAAASPPSATPAEPSGTVATSADASWTVRMDGAGPLRVGMTEDEARAALGGDVRALPAAAGSVCTYAESGRFPEGLGVMLDSGRIVRLDVRSGSVPTAEGARIGDSEDRIRQLYAGRVSEQPHKYRPDGRYLTVSADGNAPGSLIFETAAGRVTRYRAGQRPQVEWVEGCS